MQGVKTVLVCGALGAMVMGCGRADGTVDDVPSTGGGTSTGQTGGGIPAQSFPADGTCNTLEGSSLPMVMDQMSTTPPNMSGGSLGDGTYVLNRYEWYDKNARLSRRKIMIVFSNGGRTASYYWQRNDDVEQRVVATVFTDGSKIAFRGQCPVGHDLEWDRFSLTGDGLTLFSTSDTKSAIFSRR